MQNDIWQQGSSESREQGVSNTNDFIKKLYRLLEDPSISDILSWGPQGDYFVVKDVNEFTKTILPLFFKHSNFASFVRQLNKYDFHKVKNMDAYQYDEHCWTFRHPDFRANRKDTLENIRRKSSNSHRGPEQFHPTPSPPSQDNAIDALRFQIEQLGQMQGAMFTQIRDIMTDSHQRLQRQEKMIEDMLKFLSQKCRGQ